MSHAPVDLVDRLRVCRGWQRAVVVAAVMCLAATCSSGEIVATSAAEDTIVDTFNLNTPVATTPPLVGEPRGFVPTPSPVAIATPVTAVAITSVPLPAVPLPAVPPTAVPPTAVPPTAVPPTAVQPTAVPPTAVQPTAVPPVPPTAVPPVPPTAVPPTAVPPVPPTAVPTVEAGAEAPSVLATVAPPTLVPTPASQAILVANGGEVYTLNCARCHAENGLGTGQYSSPLIGIGNTYSTAAMIAELTDGHPVTFGFADRLSADEIASVVAYVKARFR